MSGGAAGVSDRNQEKASQPELSAWVSANAGSGKTTVLVRRVLRLLLHVDPDTGLPTRPQNILCLTYTKAAAGEMKNRLFGELAAWATCSEKELEEKLAALMDRPPRAEEMDRARALFARTLDTPGGLKIYTIHAFCERLLHRFPLEANVPAGFSVLDEHAAQELIDAAMDEVLERAADSRSPLHEALLQVAAVTGEEGFRSVVGLLLRKREPLRRLIQERGGETLAQSERGLIAARLGAATDALEADLTREMAGVLSDAQIREAIAVLDTGKASDKKVARALAELLAAGDDAAARAAALDAVFLTKSERTRVKRLITKDLGDANPEVSRTLAEAQEKFCSLAETRDALRVANASAALLALCESIVAAYEERKRRRAALDYDDLIEKTASLLSNPPAAAWVLYKLDTGIDHVLVDEAQDTSPAQWRVIRALTQEFFAGLGARATARTVFAVGDEKQSIYSFQGADPESFAQQGRAYERLAKGAQQCFEAIPLTVSFRSTATVLSAVDAVFACGSEAEKGVRFGSEAVAHQAVRAREAGLVEVWPVIKPDGEAGAGPFQPHEEAAGPGKPVELLANRIAAKIARWLDRSDPEILASQGRPIRPGDILILLRRRDPFAGAMIRALKERDIPVAGADRMVLTEQLAVMDLIALTEFLLMPRDDLSLACVLKSPLFGFDDDDLFALAHAREGSLWQALRAAAGRHEGFRQAAARLEGWLAQADMVPPYEFFAGLLEEHGMEMRKRLIARLGPDAADALDEFLSMALAYEQEAPVSLQGFLHYLASGEAQVKRDMEQGRDEVRIMTVHGAKGLEAEIVFLPDTCAMPAGERGGTLLEVSAQATMPDPADHIVWVPPGSMRHDPIEEAKETRKARELEEYNRLLYVAMTRARDRLYVCGWETGRKRGAGCWYNLVREGLKDLVREVEDADSGETVWRYESGQAAVLKDEPEREAAAAAPLPQWAQTPPAAEPPAALPVAPSALSVAQGAESLPGQSVRSPLEMADGARFARGRIIHALLEHLPAIAPGERAAAARKFVAARGDALGEDERERLISETMAVLEDERFAPLFGPRSLAEVPLAALLQREGEDLPAYQVTGQIDRIAILDDAILIVDYKTNRPPAQRAEDIAPAYLAQLAAYRAALRGVFAGRAIHAALLWTDTPKLMPVPEPLLDAAEAALRGRR